MCDWSSLAYQNPRAQPIAVQEHASAQNVFLCKPSSPTVHLAGNVTRCDLCAGTYERRSDMGVRHDGLVDTTRVKVSGLPGRGG